MTAGEGLFAGCIVLALVYLYAQTRDRWPWRRIASRFALVLLAAGAVFAGYDFLGKYLESHPRLVDTLQGVRVGEKFSDAVFRMGQFEQVPTGNGGAYGDDALYYQAERRLFLRVREGMIEGIGYSCRPEGEQASVNGIACGDTGEALLKRFGSDLRILCFDDRDQRGLKNQRAYDVPRYGLRYRLYLNQVISLYVTEPARLAVSAGERWVECP